MTDREEPKLEIVLKKKYAKKIIFRNLPFMCVFEFFFF